MNLIEQKTYQEKINFKKFSKQYLENFIFSIKENTNKITQIKNEKISIEFLMEEYEKKEIKQNLISIQEEIFKFIYHLSENADDNFLDFNSKINYDVIFFINNNKKYLKNNFNDFHIKYLVDLVDYIIKNFRNGSMKKFNLAFFIKNKETIPKQILKEFYFINNERNFYTKLIKAYDDFIDNLN